MKSCLDDGELLHLLIADAGEYADDRAHLAECSRCAERYEEVARDAGTITSALTQAADHLRGRESAAMPSVDTRVGGGFRTAAIFSGAAAFGGAAAFALLIALGWRPASAPNRLAQAPANTSVSDIAAANRGAAAGRAVAANDASGSLAATGALYTAETITSDPLAGLIYSASLPAANSNSYEDMLFCVPEEDGAICSSSAEQG